MSGTVPELPPSRHGESAEPRSATRVHWRWASALLWVYPARFRRRHRAEYLRVLDADWRSADDLPVVARYGRRFRVAAETIACGTLERFNAISEAIGLGRRARAARGYRNPIAGLALDCTSAVRDLRRSPGFTVAALLTLATGIGVNATIYTLVESVAMRPLPYPDADRLGALRIVPRNGERWPGLSVAEFDALAGRTDLFAGVGGIRPNYAEVLPIELDVTSVQEPEQLQGVEVTPGLLPTLGIAPRLGRSIAVEDRDGDDGDTLGYVLSHEYWTRAFDADPAVIGESITVEHRAKTIVGVLPPGIRLLLDPHDGVPVTADLWTRTHRFAAENDTHYLRTIVRLVDDLGFDDARAALATLAMNWQRQRPDL